MAKYDGSQATVRVAKPLSYNRLPTELFTVCLQYQSDLLAGLHL